MKIDGLPRQAWVNIETTQTQWCFAQGTKGSRARVRTVVRRRAPWLKRSIRCGKSLSWRRFLVCLETLDQLPSHALGKRNGKKKKRRFVQASEMFLTSGDVFYADLAERIALNALPGAFMNGSMWCKSSQLYCLCHSVTLSLYHSVTQRPHCNRCTVHRS